MTHHETTDASVAPLDPARKQLPLSAHLKHATVAIHEQIEHGSKITREIVVKVPGDASIDQYREAYKQFLLSAYSFEAGVLDRVKRFHQTTDLLELGYESEAADAAELILKDLAHLSGGNAVSYPALMTNLPALNSVADLAGIEYVRRGSRNGNAFIAHIVRQNLNLGPGSGASFLNLDAGQTKAHWDAFKLWLDALELSPAETERAVAIAIATFQAVGEWHRKYE